MSNDKYYVDPIWCFECHAEAAAELARLHKWCDETEAERDTARRDYECMFNFYKAAESEAKRLAGENNRLTAQLAEAIEREQALAASFAALSHATETLEDAVRGGDPYSDYDGLCAMLRRCRIARGGDPQTISWSEPQDPTTWDASADPDLCVDEGCPHYGTAHVCRSCPDQLDGWP